VSSISFSWAVAVIRFDRDVAPGYGPTDAVTHHPTGYWLEPTLLAQAAGLPIAWNAVQVFGEPPDWLTGVLGAALERVGLVAVRDEPSLRTIAPLWGIHLTGPPRPASGRSLKARRGARGCGAAGAARRSAGDWR
jgi:hypothetical protein